MASTTLKAYLDELESLMDKEALEEVMGHCRHILQHFPKNVETYRILGRALLDKKRYAEAGDVFQRVLSAYPSDFVAHLGMSSVAEEQGQFPASIWHLERAYELDSSNTALQDELKRLIEKRDGVSPQRIQLTRGGLAYLYAKGRLYDQAVLELTEALAQMPERIDLELLLAQVYWDSERHVEAADTALHVLERLPDCVEANKILGSLWLRGGRPSDAAPFMDRLEQLNPFLAWDTLNPDGKELPEKAFQIQHLDWDARAAAALTNDVPDWVSAISNVFESPETVSLTGGVTDWLAPATPSPTTPVETHAPSPRASMLNSKLAAKSKDADDDVPDWFKESSSSSTDDVPDWFKEAAPDITPTPATSSPVDISDNIPDWFAEPTSSASAVSPAPIAPTPLSQAPSIADWLNDEPEPQAESSAIPSWLDDDMPALEDIAGSSEQLPSGFTDLLAGRGSAPNAVSSTFGDQSTQSTIPNAENMPSWLVDAEPAPPSEPAPSGDVMDAMSWLVTGPLTPPADMQEPLSTPAEAVDNTNSIDTNNIDFNNTDFGNIDFDNLDFGNAATPELETTGGSNTDFDNADFDDAGLGSFDWMNESITAEASNPTDSHNTPSSDMSFDDTLSWLNSIEPTSSPAIESNIESDSLSGLLSSAANTHSPIEPAEDDSLAWMSDASLESQTASPAEDAPSWMSNLDTTSAPASFDTFESELGSLRAEPVEEDPLAWMRDTSPEAQTSSEQPANEANDSLSWMDNANIGSTDFDTFESELGSLRAEPVEEDPLAWMRDTSLEAQTQTEQPTNEANDSLSWMNSANANSSSIDSTEEDPLAWMRDTSLEAQASTETPVSSSLDWMNQSTTEEEPTTIQSEEDPLAWMRSYGIAPTEILPASRLGRDFEKDWPLEEEPTKAPSIGSKPISETPDWLSSAGTNIEADVAEMGAGAEPEPLEAMDFSSFSNATLNNLSDNADTLDWMSASNASSSPDAIDDEDADEWLSKFMSPSSTQSDTSSSVTPPPASSPNIELEEDWLASFESATFPTPTSEAQDSSFVGSTSNSTPESWLDQDSVESASETSDWLSDFSANAFENAQNTKSEDTGLDWMSELPTQSEQATAASGSSDWMSSFSLGTDIPELSGISADSDESSDESDSEADMPSWMQGLNPLPIDLPDASASKAEAVTDTSKNRFEDLIKDISNKASEPQPRTETGVLDPGALPDWLTGISVEPETTNTTHTQTANSQLNGQEVEFDSLFDDFDMGSLDEQAEADVEAGEMPDWLISSAPIQSTSTQTAQPLANLDFGKLENATPSNVSSEAEADWLSEFSVEPNASQTSQPTSSSVQARHEMPGHFPEVDLSNLPDDDAEPVNDPETAFSFSFDKVAQPSNLDNTNAESETASFSFKRKPAWLAKKQSGKPKTEIKPTQNDVPDWLNDSDLFSGDTDNSSPDWLK